MKKIFLLGLFLAVLIGTVCYAAPAPAADLQVTWDANTESDLAGCKVFWGTAPGVYGAPVVLGKAATSYLLTGLPWDTTYYVALKAFDTSANESGFSVEVNASTGPPPPPPPDLTPPDPPTGVKVARPVSGLGN
jgi:hypothetical protein